MLPTDGMQYLQMENARLRQENERLQSAVRRLQRAVQALNCLLNALSDITPEVDAISLVRKVLATAVQAVDSDNGSLLLLDEGRGELVFAAVTGENAEILKGYRIPADEGVVGWCLQHRRPRLVADARLDPDFSPLVDRHIAFQTRSLMAIPLLAGERVLGALEVVNTRSGEPFTEDDLDVMRLVGHLASEVLARAEEAVAARG